MEHHKGCLHNYANVSQQELDIPLPHHGLRIRMIRAAVVLAVALMPAAIGMFHVSVHPLLPYPQPTDSVGPATQRFEQSPHVRQETQAYLRAKHRVTTVFVPVFVAAMAACVGLGLLGVARPLGWAFLEACISTMAHLVSDGQGACFGPAIWTLVPFWPLIGLGKGIRAIIKRKS